VIVTDREKCRVSGNCVVVCDAESRQLVGREMSVAQVLAEVEKDRSFFDQSGGGVTISGGEPLAQRAFLVELLAACRERGIHTTVDTSGHADWRGIELVRPYVDLFLFDLKMMDDARHKKYVGVSNRKILANLSRLAEAGQRLIVRIPVIPGINDDEAGLRQAGAFLSALQSLSLSKGPPVELLAYHHTALAKYTGLGLEYGLSDLHSPDAGRMETVAGILREYGLQVAV
jgi:pyruvate formate lyase activating enzyme